MWTCSRLGVSIGDVVSCKEYSLRGNLIRRRMGRKGFYTSFYEMTDYVQDLVSGIKRRTV